MEKPIGPAEFKQKLESDLGLQMIVAGMTQMVDNGHDPREVFRYMRSAEKNTFHALVDIANGKG